MKTYLLQRLVVALLTLFGMSVVIFVLLRLAPGEIGYIVNDSDAKLLFGDEGLIASLGDTKSLGALKGVIRMEEGYTRWRDAQPAREPGLAREFLIFHVPHIDFVFVVCAHGANLLPR